MKGKNKISPTTFFNSRVTATISVSLVLFLLGLVAFISLFANNLSTYVKENLSFDIVLSDDVKDAQIKSLQKRLDIQEYVKSTRFISKEEAAMQLEKDMGENLEDFLGYNPLPALIEVKLKSGYANSDSIAVIEKEIRGMSTNISDVQYRKELIQLVNDNMKKISFGILGLATLLLFISFALISNTIRLMVYSKRFLIHTMKLVGASHKFIRRPFIISNIISGIISAFIAISLLLWLLYYLSQNMYDFIGLIDLNMLLLLLLIVVLLGIAISVIATYFSVNKYLKMREKEMYYI